MINNKYGKVYIDCMKDCGENTGGYYCVVYSDKYFENEIDNFCIYPDDCDCNNQEEVEKFLQQYAEMYRYYI